jgi:hypothetical protein
VWPEGGGESPARREAGAGYAFHVKQWRNSSSSALPSWLSSRRMSRGPTFTTCSSDAVGSRGCGSGAAGTRRGRVVRRHENCSDLAFLLNRDVNGHSRVTTERSLSVPVERGFCALGRVVFAMVLRGAHIASDRSQIDSLQLERRLGHSGTGVPGDHGNMHLHC